MKLTLCFILFFLPQLLWADAVKSRFYFLSGTIYGSEVDDAINSLIYRWDRDILHLPIKVLSIHRDYTPFTAVDFSISNFDDISLFYTLHDWALYTKKIVRWRQATFLFTEALRDSDSSALFYAGMADVGSFRLEPLFPCVIMVNCPKRKGAGNICGLIAAHELGHCMKVPHMNPPEYEPNIMQAGGFGSKDANNQYRFNAHALRIIYRHVVVVNRRIIQSIRKLYNETGSRIYKRRLRKRQKELMLYVPRTAS